MIQILKILKNLNNSFWISSLNKNSVFKTKKKKSATWQEIGHVVSVGNLVAQMMELIYFWINPKLKMFTKKVNKNKHVLCCVFFFPEWSATDYLRILHNTVWIPVCVIADICAVVFLLADLCGYNYNDYIRIRLNFFTFCRKVKESLTEKRVAFLLLILKLLFVTYLLKQSNIIFQNTGWFPFPKNTDALTIFLILIFVRTFIIYMKLYSEKYIKNLSNWSEKKKKKCTSALNCN